MSWMEQHSRASDQPLRRELLERLRSELGLVASPPSTGNRPYLNFHASPQYGRSRIGVLQLRQRGRFYVKLNPAWASEFPEAEPAQNKYLTL